jgi:2,3-dihydroxybenzoate decarboxylase
MASKAKARIIAIEEHYWDKELSGKHADSGRQVPEIARRLNDLNELRIKEMDEAGIDVQVLSHGGAGTQKLDPATAVALAPKVNDRLYETVHAHPDRFAAFAVIPTPDPKAAADELERCVTKLGFKGAMVHGLTNGEFLDNKKFWPIYARAEALDVPLYLHPATPHPAVIEAYYKDYAKEFPAIVNAAMGYTFETAAQALRLVLSRVFETHPKLKIILGHLGEGLPFLLWRIDHTLRNPGNAQIDFRDTFCDHFYVTTSGFFSDPALLCSMLEMGADRIIFSVDWPWGNNVEGVEWLEHMSISAEDKAKMFGGNVERLLRMQTNA